MIQMSLVKPGHTSSGCYSKELPKGQILFLQHFCAPVLLINLGEGELSPFKTCPFVFATGVPTSLMSYLILRDWRYKLWLCLLTWFVPGPCLFPGQTFLVADASGKLCSRLHRARELAQQQWDLADMLVLNPTIVKGHH